LILRGKNYFLDIGEMRGVFLCKLLIMREKGKEGKIMKKTFDFRLTNKTVYAINEASKESQ